MRHNPALAMLWMTPELQGITARRIDCGDHDFWCALAPKNPAKRPGIVSGSQEGCGREAAASLQVPSQSLAGEG